MGESCSIGDVNNLMYTNIDGVTQDYDELNVDERITNIEPRLWNTIWYITMSKSEGR